MERTEKATQSGTTTLEISIPKVLAVTCLDLLHLTCDIFVRSLSGLYRSVTRDEFKKYKFHQGEQLVQLCEESSARVSTRGLHTHCQYI